jgi:ATP-dependent exoDNAse (exonuclease V) beta subunit
VDVRQLLSLDPGGADRGTLVHAWLEQVEWLEEGVPDDTALRALARLLRTRLSEGEISLLLGEFHGWLAQPAVRAALSRASYPAGATVEREVAFLHRDGEVLMHGKIDRLVRFTTPERQLAAEILDYKTDACAPGDRAALATRVAHYRPQMLAYATAVAAAHGIARERVATRLVVLAAGEVVG